MKAKDIITIKDLKPCPFCGKNERFTSYDEEKNHVVRCMNCGAVGPWAEQLSDAIKTWNERYVFVFEKGEYLKEE